MDILKLWSIANWSLCGFVYQQLYWWLNVFRAESARQEEYVELKYTYAVVHLFNNDMLSVLVNVLLKLCQAYEQPAVQSPILAGPQGSFLLSIIQPSLKLIHCLLSQVSTRFYVNDGYG